MSQANITQTAMLARQRKNTSQSSRAFTLQESRFRRAGASRPGSHAASTGSLPAGTACLPRLSPGSQGRSRIPCIGASRLIKRRPDASQPATDAGCKPLRRRVPSAVFRAGNVVTP